MNFKKLYKFKYKFKYKCQRYKKGYSNEDLFDLSNWFNTTFVNMLQEFQYNLYGYPDCPFEEIDKYDYNWVLETYNIIINEIFEHNKSEVKEDLYNEYTLDDRYIRWRIIIKRIIYCIQESCKDFSDIESINYTKYKELADKQFEYELQGKKLGPKTLKAMDNYKNKWFKEAEEFDKYTETMAMEAFTLLGTYFHALWD